MRYFAQYKQGKFEPVSSEDYRKSLRLKDDSFVIVETWKERNLNFHRKYFALLNCAINHLPEDRKFDQYRDIEFLRKYLLIMIGKCDLKVGLKGEKNYFPHSISFQRMDESEFEEVYSGTLNMLLKYFLCHLDKNEFERDILNFL